MIIPLNKSLIKELFSGESVSISNNTGDYMHPFDIKIQGRTRNAYITLDKKTTLKVNKVGLNGIQDMSISAYEYFTINNQGPKDVINISGVSCSIKERL